MIGFSMIGGGDGGGGGGGGSGGGDGDGSGGGDIPKHELSPPAAW